MSPIFRYFEIWVLALAKMNLYCKILTARLFIKPVDNDYIFSIFKVSMNVCFALLVLILIFAKFAHAASIRVTLILEHSQPSPWNALLIAGLEKAGRDFSVETAIIIAPENGNQKGIFNKAAEESQLVIVASDNMYEILRDNAANYRRKMFGVVDAGIRASNVMSITFADEQAAFLAGVVATMAAGDMGPIAWLSGKDTPAMRSLFSGYIQGAKLVKESIRVIQAVTGSFTDPQAAYKKASWLIDNGAKVLALASGFGNEKIRQNYPHIRFIDLDMVQNDPSSLGSITKAADKAVYEIVKSAVSDKFGAKEILVYNLANKGVDFVLNKSPSAKIPRLKDIERRLTELRQELIKDSIHLKSMRQKTLCDCLD